jgi:hypothetical protein
VVMDIEKKLMELQQVLFFWLECLFRFYIFAVSTDMVKELKQFFHYRSKIA